MPTAKLTDKASAFIESVLELRPRFAAFDCDGTLWSGDAGEGFFRWGFERGLVSDDIIRHETARYADYRQGKISEDDMCSEMVTLHAGLSEADVQRAAAEYFHENIAPGIFPEMKELIRRLHADGCEIWAVSSTNEWVIREAMTVFGVPDSRILAARVQVENGRVTEQMVHLPSGDGKARLIREFVKKHPDVAFGNSRWDIAMLSLSQHAIAVNPNPDLAQLADEKGWRVYWPTGTSR